MTASINALWGAPPVPAVPPADVAAASSAANTAAGGCDDGSSFKAIAGRLAKAVVPQDEPAAPDAAALAQAVVPLVPLSLPPSPTEWALPSIDAARLESAPASIPGSAGGPQAAPGLPAALAGVFPSGPIPTGPSWLPHALQPESPAIAAAPLPAPPLDLGSAAANDAGTKPLEPPHAAEPRLEPPPLPAPIAEPTPAPALNPEVLQGRAATAAPGLHDRESQPGGLSVSGMRAAQEALLRPIGAAGPRSAVAPVAGVAPAIVETVLSAASSNPMPGDLRATPNQDANTVLDLAVRRTPITVARPNDLGAAENRRSPAVAVTARAARRTNSDPIEPPPSAASRGLAASAPPEARIALGMAAANSPREMQFQADPHVAASQAPEMIATQQRIAAEMAALVRAGGGEARLDLEPAELGKLRLRLTVRNRVVEGSITVENPAVKAALEANMQGLVVALERSGLSFERMDIRLLDSRRGQDRREPKRDSETAPRDETGTGEAPATARASGRRGPGSGLVDYWF
jgi:hypothetical protein